VNLALATGNVGRPGGGCVRMGGHQEGYVRPDPPVGRPATYVDQLLIEGKGGIHQIWGCDHYKTTLERSAVSECLQTPDRHGEGCNVRRALRRSRAQIDAIMARFQKGGLFVVDVDIVPTKMAGRRTFCCGGNIRRGESDFDER